MDDSAADLRATLQSYAHWLGYGHADRVDAWLARLEINGPELKAFRESADLAVAPYAAQASLVAPAAGTLNLGESLPADVHAAAQRAVSGQGWNAFTHIPTQLATAGPGYLAGAPVVVKDLMAVAGMPMSGGSAPSCAVVPTIDAEAVARLKRHGAVVLGLANLHEFAYGITSDNPHFGRVVNPRAPDRIAGGSSGGSAAAIAGGIVRVALGTDTAGSIRIPAACCGVVGFKPSYDAVPRQGVQDLAPSLDHVGPLGLRVNDCALLFAALLDLPEVPSWAVANLNGVRVTRLSGFFEDPLDVDVHLAVQQAAAALANDGASLKAAAITGVEVAGAIQFMTICPEATEVHAKRLQSGWQHLGEDVRVRLEIGLFLPACWYLKAQRMRHQLATNIQDLLKDADLLLCPTMRVPAPAVGAASVEIAGRSYPLHTAVTQLTMPFNLAGLPAISVPWGVSRAGVPIGLQLVGPRGADWQVLAAAHRLETMAPRLAA